MKIKVSCITSEQNAAKMMVLSSDVEESLKPFFCDKSYGGDVSEFMLFINSTGYVEDIVAIERTYSKMGQYKDPFSDKKVKYLSLGISFFDSEIDQSEPDDLKKSLLEKLRIKLELFSPNKKSGFMYKEFKEELFALIQSM